MPPNIVKSPLIGATSAIVPPIHAFCGVTAWLLSTLTAITLSAPIMAALVTSNRKAA
jgi:hypothetical protein